MTKGLKKAAAGREARASVDTDAAVAERLARLPPPRALPSRAARAAAEAEIKRTSVTAAAAPPPQESAAPVPKPACGELPTCPSPWPAWCYLCMNWLPGWVSNSTRTGSVGSWLQLCGNFCSVQHLHVSSHGVMNGAIAQALSCAAGLPRLHA
jgi:hypothetical protein